ncbi:hypothetical protein ACFC09_06055 [Streptomyces sp. NPDC056161]|uniref:hypothetical protein n=1 Tax=Streptomyces sp. NPDC056161 TaxID=3345732 RepID=UPI0035DAF035
MNVKSRASAGAAALGLSVMAPFASADPAPCVYRELVGVADDTTEDVLNGLADSIDGGLLIASYDATGSTTIKTRPDGCEIARPNGSWAGIAALNNAIDNDTRCLDFVSSSRGPQTAGTDLNWISFASHRVTVAACEDGPLADVNVSTADLRAVYACTKTTLTTLTGADGQEHPVTPLISQSGSDTRGFFLGQIGNPALGDCVRETQDHNGEALTLGSDLAPYPVAKWVSQVKGLIDDVHGDTVLGAIDGGAYSRNVYNAVSTARLTDPVMAATFVRQNSKVCQATATITEYAFTTIPGCGSTVLTGEN